MPELDDLISKFLHATQERNPEVATFLGGGTGEEPLPDPSPEGMEAKKDFVRVWKERFAALDQSSLDPEAQLDLEVFLRGAELWLYNLEVLNQACHNPDPLEELSYLLFTQTRRACVDEESRFQAMARRLGGLHDYLKAFHARVQVGDTRWTEMAHQVADTFPIFLDSIRQRAQGTVSRGLAQDLHEAINDAKDSLEMHVGWLEHLPTRDGLWVLDEERFSTLLRLKGIEEYDPDALEELGRAALEACKEERDRLAREINPDLDADQVRQSLRKDRPNNVAEILDEVRELLREARAFMQDRKIATVHPWERLEVEPTPPFFRSLIPAAAYFSPTRADEVQLGTYVITPPADRALLEEFCRSALPLVSVHEGYPGHHYHIASVNRLSGILREGGILGFPTDPSGWFGGELVEGWAYYAEARMLDHGFYDTPEVRFQFQEKLVRRAARLVVDVRLSCGRFSFDDAVGYLNETADLPITYAVPEVSRNTRSPGYQLGHLLGKILLERLHEERRNVEGEAFDLLSFHNQIVSAGVLPVSLLRTHMTRTR
jgi:uncharacterized protein (DUF885 family)